MIPKHEVLLCVISCVIGGWGYNINDDSCSRIVPKQCCGQLMLPRHFRAVVFQRFHSLDFARAHFGNIVFSPVQICFLDSDM